MKKYIRTKDGVYEVVGFDEECIIPSPIIKMNGKLTHCSGYKNYKQADTIEELCDEFVLYDNQLKTCGIFDKKVITFKWLQTHLDIYKGMIIYSAIWTDKGLIFVAKMNDKGKLLFT